MMMVYALVMFFIQLQTMNMVVQLTLTFLFAVPLNHHLFPPLLHVLVLVWLLLLERSPRMKNIW